MPVADPLLLITSRPGFACQITDLADDVTLAAPETVSRDQWASAAVVLLDAAALPVLRTRTLPAVPHCWVVTDSPPAPQVFVAAVALRVERVVELPAGAAWLAQAVRAVGHRGTVIAVVGIGASADQAATTVALALAVDSVRRDESVAVVGLHRGQALALQLNALSTNTPTAEPTRSARLTVVTHGYAPAQPGDTPRLITDLAGGHERVILDTPPPPNPDARQALDRADLVLAVVTPDQRHHPHLAGLTAPGCVTADRIRVGVLTSDPTLATGWGHPLSPPGASMSRWITDPGFGHSCAALVATPTRT